MSTTASTREPLRFGIFMPSVSNMPNISRYKSQPDDWTFDNNLRIARAAEAAGFDFLFPVSRWRTIGGGIDYHGKSLETMTWAAGLLACTSRIGIFSTVHVPVFNPVVAAKMGATLDHIGAGRWGINIVSGWNRVEFDMMGIEMLDHAARYERSEDFIRILKGLWNEPPGTFSFESRHYRVRHGYVSPQPRRTPPIVNAGTSLEAREMAARQCDWAFVCPLSVADAGALAADFKARAARHGRRLRVVAMVQPVWGDSREEALAERQRVIDGMDEVAVRNWADGLGMESGSFTAQTLETFAFGAGSLPLLGTAADVADGIADLYAAGVDGVLMSYHDYVADTPRFAQEIVPLLRARHVL
jgi:alkanesulfonate monooxygenase SsuD/methylene tetrahydromethanopterin reductase-like flavin-dependent oxidoreductase (luciferase family)